MNENGEMWSTKMNSFNHYAYGSVAEWVYTFAAGIKPREAGFAEVSVCPHPDKRLGRLDVTLQTRHGNVRSAWHYYGEQVVYEITLPTKGTVVVDGRTYALEKGVYRF